jgi:methionine-S-sulfoxide reductase
MKYLLSIIMTLVVATQLSASKSNLKEAYFAGGCFWGVEYYLEAKEGVESVESGFMGGFKKDPTYQEVVYTRTGHIETVKVIYDANIISFENLTKLFFEIHDFTQVGGQGPDIGERYESYIFYNNQQERDISLKLISQLSNKGYKVATKLKASSKFYAADDYHQDYYVKHKKVPYCHAYKKIF